MQLRIIPTTSALCERSFSKTKKLEFPNGMSFKATNLNRFMMIAGNMKLLADPRDLTRIASGVK
jgi:hypothetical protein